MRFLSKPRPSAGESPSPTEDKELAQAVQKAPSRASRNATRSVGYPIVPKPCARGSLFELDVASRCPGPKTTDKVTVGDFNCPKRCALEKDVPSLDQSSVIASDTLVTGRPLAALAKMATRSSGSFISWILRAPKSHVSDYLYPPSPLAAAFRPLSPGPVLLPLLSVGVELVVGFAAVGF
jgi:hypothetical protein